VCTRRADTTRQRVFHRFAVAGLGSIIDGIA
jgi:hypothetical protein